jgi:hypothetical protein
MGKYTEHEYLSAAALLNAIPEYQFKKLKPIIYVTVKY